MYFLLDWNHPYQIQMQIFRFCSARTNDIMQHFSDTNQQLHTTHVAYRYHSEPYSQTPHFAFIYFTKNEAFSTNQPKPVFAKMLLSKKLTAKISSQTEFTMSRRLSAHSNRQKIVLTNNGMLDRYSYSVGLN